jgi:hypothetical protein
MDYLFVMVFFLNTSANFIPEYKAQFLFTALSFDFWMTIKVCQCDFVMVEEVKKGLSHNFHWT